MNTDQTVYIGIDLHSNTSTIGYMNKEGEYIGQQKHYEAGSRTIGNTNLP